MTLPLIIAICGVKRCGKDTVASYVCSKIDGSEHRKIAQPLKDVCASLFQFTKAQMEEDEKDAIDPKWGITPRDAMKFVGTEMMQYKMQELLPDIGRTFWIKQFISNISNIKQTKHIVISDMRFMHEYTMLKAAFPTSIVIKIVKPTNAHAHTHAYMSTCQNRQHEHEHDGHSSEQEWASIPEDVLIVNDGTISDLYKCVDKKVLMR